MTPLFEFILIAVGIAALALLLAAWLPLGADGSSHVMIDFEGCDP